MAHSFKNLGKHKCELCIKNITLAAGGKRKWSVERLGAERLIRRLLLESGERR